MEALLEIFRVFFSLRSFLLSSVHVHLGYVIQNISNVLYFSSIKWIKSDKEDKCTTDYDMSKNVIQNYRTDKQIFRKVGLIIKLIVKTRCNCK